MEEFFFPKTFQQLLVIESKQMLLETFIKLSKQEGHSKPSFYKIRCIKHKYIYVHCKYCKSKLIYKQQASKYRLKVQNNHHVHRDTRGNHDILRQKITKLPNQIKCSTAYKILKNQIIFSRSTFYRIFNSVKNQKFSIPQMFNCFGQQKILGYYQPFETSHPSLIIVSSPQMQSTFQKFGQFCAFDLTYNLISEQSAKSIQYKVGFFTGLNNHMKIVPFAIVITDEENKQRMAKIFYQFFKIMGKMPNTIISDEQASIKAGLQLLTYENIWYGEHLLDGFHILRNIKKKLKKKQNLQYFAEIIKAENNPEYKVKVKQLQNRILNEQKQIFNHFLQESHRFCFAKIKPTMIGFSISSSLCEKMNDLIKSKVPFSKSLGVVLKKTYQLCQQMIQNSKTFEIEKMCIEKFFNFEEIENLKYQLCKKVFNKLLKNIIKTMHCIIRSFNSKIFTINDQYGEFQVEIIEEGNSFGMFCNCQYIQKTGIPCLHLLKIALLKDFKVIELIDQRWKIDNNEIGRNAIKASKRRKTRRRK